MQTLFQPTPPLVGVVVVGKSVLIDVGGAVVGGGGDVVDDAVLGFFLTAALMR